MRHYSCEPCQTEFKTFKQFVEHRCPRTFENLGQRSMEEYV